MPRIQSQMKLREMRLRERNYLQYTEKRPREHSWRLRRQAILRSKGSNASIGDVFMDQVMKRPLGFARTVPEVDGDVRVFGEELSESTYYG